MKFSVIGIILWVSAAIYWFFEKIASVTGKELEIFTIEDIGGLEWIEKLPSFMAEPANFIGTTHISLLLLGVGLIFIIIGMFYKT